MRKKYLLLPAMLICALSFLLYACGDNQQPEPTPQTPTYTVTFNYNYDGAPASGVYKTETVDENTAVAKPADPTRTGYTFTKWYTEAACTTEYIFTAKITKDLPLYAGWEEISVPPAVETYTVTFNYNYDGAPSDGVYKTETVDEDTAVAKPADPTRTGYTFDKWYTDAAGTTEYDFETPVVAALPLYAGWTVNTYVVAYNYNYAGAPNDGIYDAENVNYNECATRPETDPTCDGFHFNKWCTDAAGTTEYDFETPVTADLTLYAEWSEQPPVKYTVTFAYNYADAPNDGVYKTSEVNGNTMVAKPANPTRTGYMFGKWYIDAACSVEYAFTTPVTAARTLYAGWTINSYTVTYNYNYTGAPNDGVYSTETVEYNETATAPATDPTRDNYAFDGWYTTDDAEALFDFTSNITQTTVIYAKWTLTSATLSVEHVEGLTDDFVMGVDASSVLSLENAGVKFYDYDGNEADVFKTLAESGVNTIRIRVWNDPFDADGNGYGGGNNGIDAAVEMGKRVTKYGMGAFIDFHYSDFWADPGKQKAPKAWADYTVDQKETAIYDFTKASLNKLKAANVNVTMVQVGNETTNGMAGVYYNSDGWDKVAKLFNAGSRAVREVYADAKVAIHFTNPEHSGNYANFAKKLNDNNVDYDVFASSWYPFWHGTLDNLNSVLNNVANTYNKQVLIAETSYAYTLDNTDEHDNTVSSKGNNNVENNGGYQFTVQGQANLVRDAINTMAHTKNGLGVCYWEGTWISVAQTGATTKAEQLELWERYGCGWAASYAGDYDADDAGKWYGGSAVDNQALFGADGHPLESLKVFKLVYDGNLEPEYKTVYISGAMNEWTPAVVAEVDLNTHTAQFNYTFGDDSVGSSKGFGITVCDRGTENPSDTDSQLCWIGGASNCKVGTQNITVTFTDNSEKLVTSSTNLYVSEKGTYSFTITFDDDNSTPLSVTVNSISYTINFNGGNSSWKDQAIEGAVIDMTTHTAEFSMTFTKDSGNFGFTINDPVSGDQVTWIGGTGNVIVNKVTISTMTIVDKSGVMEVAAGSKKRDFHMLYTGTYTYTIVFEADNVTPKTLTVVPGNDVNIPDPSGDTYNVYINGTLTGSSWTTEKCGDIDATTHTATFDYTWTRDGCAFGFKIFKNDVTSGKELCWIGQNGNVWMSSQITVTMTDNTDNFAVEGGGNITITTAGTYKVTIVFAEDNTTPISVTFDAAA